MALTLLAGYFLHTFAAVQRMVKEKNIKITAMHKGEKK